MDTFAAAIGILAAAGLCLTAVVLGVSIPIVAAQGTRVFLRREWLPFIYNLRSLSRRKLATASTFAVFTLVTFVLTSVGMLAEGIAGTLASTGGPLDAKIMQKSAFAEWSSEVPAEIVAQLSAAPGIAQNASGKAMLSGEMVVLIWAQRASGVGPDDGANLSVRGVNPMAFELHAPRALEGRWFTPGSNEIVIGKALRGRFQGAELGSKMIFADREWPVVGVTDHGGSAYDSEIWGSFEAMSPVFRTVHSTVSVVLTEPSSLDTLNAYLESRVDSSRFGAQRETDYWQARGGSYVEVVTLVGIVIGTIFAFGAVLGALNTMYAQVSARTRELGALRAIGFRPRAVLVSILAESIFLASIAGVVGVSMAAGLSHVKFEFTTVQTLNEMSYGFRLTPLVALGGLALAAVMGYAGGLLPALRAAKMPIVEAVRAE